MVTTVLDIFRCCLFNPNDTYLLVGDESVVTKAGQTTHGLDWFFASLYGKVGRPKGSRNKQQQPAELTPELAFIQILIQQVLSLISGFMPVHYLVLEGHFGHNSALDMTRHCGRHLISKLRHNSALYFPHATRYRGCGRPPKYGAKVDYRHLSEQDLKQVHLEGTLETRIYQMTLLHKHFNQALHVVIIVKINLQTGSTSHVVLFSSDLHLTYDLLIDYYQLRFQIEFNFRDAKQYWGLEDFMNVSETAVRNAANLSLFMVNTLAAPFATTNTSCPCS